MPWPPLPVAALMAPSGKSSGMGCGFDHVFPSSRLSTMWSIQPSSLILA